MLNKNSTILLSSNFCDWVTDSFNTTTKFNLISITRSYYVLMDLKAGINVSKIEQYRLKSFHSTLLNYLLKNNNDKLSLMLYNICDKELSNF